MNLLLNLFLNVIEISFNTSLIIITALIFRKVIGKRFSAAGRYIIWILIILRLAVPFTPDFGFSVFELKTDGIVSDNVSAQISSPEIIGTTYEAQAPVNLSSAWSEVTFSDISKQSVSVFAETENGTFDKIEITFADIFSTLLDVAAAIWIIGVLVSVLWNFIGYRIFTQNMERDQLLVHDKHILMMLEQMCVKLRINYLPELYFCDSISSPLIYGILLKRKRIVIPSDIGNSAAVASILRHELVHLKRGDLWVKLILLAAESLHWFNPLLKVNSKYLELDMELSCDEKVLDGCNKSVRRTYGRILIDIAQRCTFRPTLLTTHFNPEFNDLKTRCINILDTETKHRGTFIAILFAVLCVLSGTVLNCAEIPPYVNSDTVRENYIVESEKIDLQNSNIILSNKINSVIDTSDNFELTSFLNFVDRFSKVIYGDINSSSDIDFSNENILSYILDETHLREGCIDADSVRQTINNIFDIQTNIPEETISYMGDITDVPELLINIINVNANEYGEVVVRMMLYDISAADSGMSSDTYIGDGTYYFNFRDDSKYGQIYTFRFCFGEREYSNPKKFNSPVLTQSRDNSLCITYSDTSVMMTPAYFNGNSSSLGTFNKLSSVGRTTAIAGKASEEYNEPIRVYVTHDYGVSWTITDIDHTQFMPDTGMKYPVINFMFNFVNENQGVLILCTKRPELFVYITNDGGITWNRQSGAIPSDSNETLYSGGFVTNEIGFASMVPVYDSESNPKLYMTRDGGFSWQRVAVTIPSNYENDSVWRILPGIPELCDGQIRIPMVINMRDVLYYVSDNMGETWYWN